MPLKFTNQQSDVWLKAAVIGSSWASFEIIVGSFLHNLRLPFAGMLLSAASVMLLSAFVNLWPQRGLLIRAGLVCALMKSISPSALVFGPMIGITMEALIMEAVLFLFGRHVIAIALAGGLAVLWSLFQKIINLIILYGLNLIQIADSFYQYLIKITGLKALSLLELLIIAGGFYVFLGMMAAVAGNAAGRRYIKNAGAKTPLIDLTEDTGFSEPKPELRTHTYILPLLVGVLAAVLLLLNFKMYWFAIPGGLAVSIFILFRYRQALRRLSKPAVWIQFAVISLVAAMLLESVNVGFAFSIKGLWVGIEMIFRAILLIFTFSALAVELRNPVLKAVLNRHGFSKLYQSTSLAFSALPALIAAMPKWQTMLKNPQQALYQVMGRAEQLLKQFNTDGIKRQIVILTGEVHQGKTTFLQQMLALMHEKGMKTAGILSKACFENGIQIGYDLWLFPKKESIPLARTHAVEGWTDFRRFSFNPEAFVAGTRQLMHDSYDSQCWLVVDELGPMELEGKGWYDTVSLLLAKNHQRMIWVVRKNLVPAMLTHFAAERVLTIDIGQHTADEALEMLK